MLTKLIIENYGLKVESLKLIDSYFGTEIFILKTDQGKYIVKTLPIYCEGLENEGYITDFLYKK